MPELTTNLYVIIVIASWPVLGLLGELAMEYVDKRLLRKGGTPYLIRDMGFLWRYVLPIPFGWVTFGVAIGGLWNYWFNFTPVKAPANAKPSP